MSSPSGVNETEMLFVGLLTLDRTAKQSTHFSFSSEKFSLEIRISQVGRYDRLALTVRYQGSGSEREIVRESQQLFDENPFISDKSFMIISCSLCFSVNPEHQELVFRDLFLSLTGRKGS